MAVKPIFIQPNMARALNRTWDIIAMDIFDCLEGKKVMKRAHVIEVVLDANYLESYGSGGSAEVEAEIKEFRKLDYKTQVRMAKQVFLHQTYSY